MNKLKQITNCLLSLILVINGFSWCYAEGDIQQFRYTYGYSSNDTYYSSPIKVVMDSSLTAKASYIGCDDLVLPRASGKIKGLSFYADNGKSCILFSNSLTGLTTTDGISVSVGDLMRPNLQTVLVNYTRIDGNTLEDTYLNIEFSFRNPTLDFYNNKQELIATGKSDNAFTDLVIGNSDKTYCSGFESFASDSTTTEGNIVSTTNTKDSITYTSKYDKEKCITTLGIKMPLKTAFEIKKATNTANQVNYGFRKASITKPLNIPDDVLCKTTGSYHLITVTEGETAILDPIKIDTIDPLFNSNVRINGLTGTGDVTIQNGNLYKNSKSIAKIKKTNDNKIEIKTNILDENLWSDGVRFNYSYNNQTYNGGSVTVRDGTIELNVSLANTAPKRQYGNIVIPKKARLGEITKLDISDILTNALGKDIFVDREGDALSIVSCSDIDNFTSLIGGQILVDLREDTIHYGGDTLPIAVTLTDGEFNCDGNIAVKILDGYVTPSFDRQDFNISIYESRLEKKSIPLKGSYSGDDADRYTVEVESVKLNGITKVSAKTVVATVKKEKDTNTNTLEFNFDLNNKDSIQEGDYFLIDVKIQSDTGVVTHNYITVTITPDGMENSEEGVIYVHRKPIAMFQVAQTRESGKLKTAKVSNSKLSYDPDFQSSIEDGIYAVKWVVQVIGGTTKKTIERTRVEQGFTGRANGKLDNATNTTGSTQIMLSQAEADVNNAIAEAIASADMYDSSGSQRQLSISLYVQDRCNTDWKEGAWSTPYLVTLDGKTNNAPVALFTIDKQAYIMPYNSDTFNMTITDNSFDPDGDTINKWSWVLYDSKGNTLHSKVITDLSQISTVANEIKSKAIEKALSIQSNNNGYTTNFSIGLIVSANNQNSSEYKQNFSIHKENDTPTFDSTDAKVYLDDPAKDGICGDEYGKASNSKSKIPATMLNIKDTYHQDLKADYQFDGQSVNNTVGFSKINPIEHTLTKTGLSINNGTTEAPFGNKTATELGLIPGAYRITTTVSDVAKGPLMLNGDASTFTTDDTHFLRVIPYLSLWLNYECDGWVNSQYRKSDGKTLSELGLSVEDILPSAGSEIDIIGYTNEYVDEYVVYSDYDCNNEIDNINEYVSLTKTGDTAEINGSTVYEWKGTIKLPEEGIEGDNYNKANLIGEVRTKWVGTKDDTSIQRTKRRSVLVPIEPVKVYDFNVNRITDRKYSYHFQNYLNGSNGAYVKDLAVDSNSYKNASNARIRKGYAFEFNLKSKGLQDNSSEIVIYPHFYTSDMNTELKAWIPNETGTYEMFNCYYKNEGTLSDYNTEINKMYTLETKDRDVIGSIGRIILGEKVKTNLSTEQYWEGRYGIPIDTKFTTTETLNATNVYSGDVLVTFDIRARKKGTEKYNYVQKKQWLKERTGYSANKQVYVDAEAKWYSEKKYIGAVIMYNNKNTALDDYTSQPIWKE